MRDPFKAIIERNDRMFPAIPGKLEGGPLSLAATQSLMGELVPAMKLEKKRKTDSWLQSIVDQRLIGSLDAAQKAWDLGGEEAVIAESDKYLKWRQDTLTPYTTDEEGMFDIGKLAFMMLCTLST